MGSLPTKKTYIRDIGKYTMQKREALDRLMKLSTSNHKFLYSICDKEETYNDAVTKLIRIAKPILLKQGGITD